MLHQIGIAEMLVSDSVEDVLATYSLGSCLGVTLYDSVRRAGGMVHCMLPSSKSDPAKASDKPAMFVDTGVSALLQELFNRGARRNRIEARVAGGAAILDEHGFFKIGERNYTMLRKVLWRNGILIAAENVGGTAARSMFLHIDTGRTEIRSNGNLFEL